MRIAAIADPAEIADPAYAEGLRRAVPGAIGFGLDALEATEAREPPVPVELLAQARLAARNQIPLDTVLRRYFAGYSLLGFHLIEEASGEGLMDGAELQRLTARLAGHFDRLLAQVAAEHGRELESPRAETAERRRLDAVKRLLGGEPVDPSRLAYELGAHHLAIIARGPDPAPPLRELARSLDCGLLLVRPDEDTAWAWLGGRAPLAPEKALDAAAQLGSDPSRPALALGEPAEGLAGWRLTHRQARAALSIALRGREPLVRYADVALLAAILQDDLPATSLRRLYLEPLEAERDGGAVLRETLRAYFAAERNVSSAAAALGVSWQTVKNRLRAIEGLLGRSLDGRLMDLEAALALAELEDPPAREDSETHKPKRLRPMKLSKREIPSR